MEVTYVHEPFHSSIKVKQTLLRKYRLAVKNKFEFCGEADKVYQQWERLKVADQKQRGNTYLESKGKQNKSGRWRIFERDGEKSRVKKIQKKLKHCIRK